MGQHLKPMGIYGTYQMFGDVLITHLLRNTSLGVPNFWQLQRVHRSSEVVLAADCWSLRTVDTGTETVNGWMNMGYALQATYNWNITDPIIVWLICSKINMFFHHTGGDPSWHFFPRGNAHLLMIHSRGEGTFQSFENYCSLAALGNLSWNLRYLAVGKPRKHPSKQS